MVCAVDSSTLLIKISCHRGYIGHVPSDWFDPIWRITAVCLHVHCEGYMFIKRVQAVVVSLNLFHQTQKKKKNAAEKFASIVRYRFRPLHARRHTTLKRGMHNDTVFLRNCTSYVLTLCPSPTIVQFCTTIKRPTINLRFSKSESDFSVGDICLKSL